MRPKRDRGFPQPVLNLYGRTLCAYLYGRTLCACAAFRIVPGVRKLYTPESTVASEQTAWLKVYGEDRKNDNPLSKLGNKGKMVRFPHTHTLAPHIPHVSTLTLVPVLLHAG